MNTLWNFRRKHIYEISSFKGILASVGKKNVAISDAATDFVYGAFPINVNERKKLENFSVALHQFSCALVEEGISLSGQTKPAGLKQVLRQILRISFWASKAKSSSQCVKEFLLSRNSIITITDALVSSLTHAGANDVYLRKSAEFLFRKAKDDTPDNMARTMDERILRIILAGMLHFGISFKLPGLATLWKTSEFRSLLCVPV